MQISIVLGSYNRFRLLKKTIKSAREEKKRSGLQCEIIVVDGGSSDGTITWLTKQKDIISIIQYNHGTWNGEPIKRRSWGYFMNLGFKCAQGKYICMVSDDCLIIPNAIKNGYKLAEKKLRDGVNIGGIAFYWRNWPEEKKYFVAFAGAYPLINHGIYLKKALIDVNYIDEDNYFFYHADTDLVFRMIHKGYSFIKSENSFIEHYSHANNKIRKSNSLKIEQDTIKFNEKWKDFGGSLNWHKKEKEFLDPTNTIEIYKKIRRYNTLRHLNYRLVNFIFK